MGHLPDQYIGNVLLFIPIWFGLAGARPGLQIKCLGLNDGRDHP
jgi:hypothetical protein